MQRVVSSDFVRIPYNGFRKQQISFNVIIPAICPYKPYALLLVEETYGTVENIASGIGRLPFEKECVVEKAALLVEIFFPQEYPA